MIYQDMLVEAELAQYAADLNGRARQSGAPGRIDIEALRDRILACGGRCEWCGVSLVAVEFELDHVISLKGGGGHSPANLAVACPECNRRKGQKHPARFAAEIYSETGRRTTLLERVFAHFALDPTEQLSLFDERPESAKVSAAPEPAEQPHYRW